MSIKRKEERTVGPMADGRTDRKKKISFRGVDPEILNGRWGTIQNMTQKHIEKGDKDKKKRFLAYICP